MTLQDKTNVKGLFAGMCGLDIIYYDSRPLLAENEKDKYTDYHYAVGGPASNAAITYAALAGSSVLVTALGTSPLAQFLKAKLKSLNVEVIDLVNDDRSINISSVYVNTSNGSRTVLSGQNPQKVSIPDDIIPAGLTFAEYDGSLPGIEKQLYDRAEEIVLDLGSDKESYLKCFGPKTAAIASEKYRHGKEGIFDLNEKYGFAFCAASYGEKPLRYLWKGKTCSLPVRKVRTVSTLGAGDVLHGAYCYYRYEKKLDCPAALRKAADFASLMTEKRSVEEGIRHAGNSVSH